MYVSRAITRSKGWSHKDLPKDGYLTDTFTL